MAIPTSITDLDANEAMNSPAGSDNVGGTLDNFLRSHAAIIKRQFSKGADLNSASTMTLPPDGSFFNVVNVVSAINGFTNNFDGRIVYLKFEAGITLNHSGALILPAGVNITTVANDVACFLNEGANVWRCLSYPRYEDSGYAGPEPTITWPHMPWFDVANSTFKRRNAGNTAWYVQDTAARTPFTPAGNLSSTNVQAAIQELDAEKQPVGNYQPALGYTPANKAGDNFTGSIGVTGNVTATATVAAGNTADWGSYAAAYADGSIFLGNAYNRYRIFREEGRLMFGLYTGTGTWQHNPMYLDGDRLRLVYRPVVGGTDVAIRGEWTAHSGGNVIITLTGNGTFMASNGFCVTGVQTDSTGIVRYLVTTRIIVS